MNKHAAAAMAQPAVGPDDFFGHSHPSFFNKREMMYLISEIGLLIF